MSKILIYQSPCDTIKKQLMLKNKTVFNSQLQLENNYEYTIDPIEIRINLSELILIYILDSTLAFLF